MESTFYRTFKVHSKVTFQSPSTEHVRLMPNQAWWTCLAIVNMSHRKRVQTLQIKARVKQRKMTQKKNSVLIRTKRMRIKGNRKKITDHTWLHYEEEAMFCYFCRKSKKTNPLNHQKGVQISVPLKIKMSPKLLAKGTNCPPVMKS